MKRLRIHHRTVYRYARPVTFGPHRLVFRPRDSHDLRLLDTKLIIAPAASLHWLHDPFGNSVAIATFTEEPARELVFESTLEVEHYGVSGETALSRADAHWPFDYQRDAADLAPSVVRVAPDAEGRVDAWARRFVRNEGSTPARELLVSMAEAIRSELAYTPRDGEGTQSPAETLTRAAGSCRDYAVLMIDACRALGIAARFVSGYLYDPKLDTEEPEHLSTTHAWVCVFVPGAGWIEIDPTNGLVAGDTLVRVATARDPEQVAPLSGTYAGTREDFVGMDVDVRVRAI